MPVTLIETVGAANANTYASLAEYKAYIETRVPYVEWRDLAILGTTIDEQLEIDLIAACRLLSNNLKWTGTAASETQVLSWPRNGMYSRNGVLIASNVNPVDLKLAQCEYAIQIRNGDLLSDNDAAAKGVSKVKAGSVEVGFHAIDTSTNESVDIIVRRSSPEFAWMRVPQAVRDLLVDSWYARELVSESKYEGYFRVH